MTSSDRLAPALRKTIISEFLARKNCIAQCVRLEKTEAGASDYSGGEENPHLLLTDWFSLMQIAMAKRLKGPIVRQWRHCSGIRAARKRVKEKSCRMLVPG